MRWTRVGIVVLLAAAAVAAQDIEKTRAAVQADVEAGLNVKAATTLGRAIGQAQRKGDLPAVQQLVDILRESFADIDRLQDPSAPEGYRPVCEALMKGLDPGRCHAYISAHHLAYELVFQSVRAGDGKYFKPALAVARKFGKKKDAGAYAKLMGDLAHGLTLVRKKKPSEKALERLRETANTARDNGWYEAGGYAMIELAEAAGRIDLNEETVGMAGLVLVYRKGDADPRALARYFDAWNRRLRLKLPHAVDLDEAERKAAESAPAESDGEPPEGVPALGPAWEKLSRAAVLAGVRYASGQYTITHGFEDHGRTVPRYPIVVHWSHGGATIATYRNGVDVLALDFDRHRKRPVGAVFPANWHFHYYLADGETWTVNKMGVVTIK